jgi:hypothetical protein
MLLRPPKVRPMTDDVSFEQMKASIGSLIILWSRIERAGREEITRANDGILPKSVHGIAATLSAWEASVSHRRNVEPLRALLASALRAQLQDPLVVRNGVCHGIVALSASYHDQPASLCWEFKDIKRSLTWNELQVMFSWLSKLPFAMSMISNTESGVLGNRISDNAENREWWTAEFGIVLS